MKQVTLDCSKMTVPDEVHDLFAQALDFPDWYGHNLDALMDCLTDLDETAITLTGWRELGFPAEGFWQVFRQAATDNPDLTVIFA